MNRRASALPFTTTSLFFLFSFAPKRLFKSAYPSVHNAFVMLSLFSLLGATYAVFTVLFFLFLSLLFFFLLSFSFFRVLPPPPPPPPPLPPYPYHRVAGRGLVLRRSSKHWGIVVVVLDFDVDRSRPDLSITAIPLIPAAVKWVRKRGGSEGEGGK